MSGLMAVILLIVTVNPPRRRAELGEDWRVVAAGAGLTLVVLTVLGGLGEWMLDGLDITAPTFRVAVGLVLLVRGAVDLVRSPAAPIEPPGGAVVPVFFPVLFRPELGLVAVSVTADAGFGPMALGTALGLALVVSAIARLDRPRY